MRPARRFPFVSLLLGAAAVAVYASPLLPTLLEYDRVQIAAGQAWRVAACHWTHWSAGHLFWDVAMFVLLGAVCERISRQKTCLAIFSAAIIIPAALWAVSPNLTGYRGLSGLDSALFGLAAVPVLQRSMARGDRSRTLLTMICLAAFPAKIIFEMATGSAVFVHDASGMIPVPLAHLVGAIVGGTTACFHQPFARVQPKVVHVIEKNAVREIHDNPTPGPSW